MITWFIVVRHSPDYVDPIDKKVYPYPLEGFAISAFNDKEKADMFAKNSDTPYDKYEVIEVSRFQPIKTMVRPVFPVDIEI